MRSGDVGGTAGVTTKTIRFWGSRGLLANPTRTPSRYREYRPGTAERLSSIRHAQAAGLTLGEVRQVLAISDDGTSAGTSASLSVTTSPTSTSESKS